MAIELQRRAVLGGAIAGAALLQSRAFAQSGPNSEDYSLERSTPACAAGAALKA